MNNDEIRSLRRDIRYAALPGRMSFGCLTLLLFVLAGCGAYGILFMTQFFWELAHLTGGH